MYIMKVSKLTTKQVEYWPERKVEILGRAA